MTYRSFNIVYFSPLLNFIPLENYHFNRKQQRVWLKSRQDPCFPGTHYLCHHAECTRYECSGSVGAERMGQSWYW
jgi:hypothetical protein